MTIRNIFLICCSIALLGAVCVSRPVYAGLSENMQSIATKMKQVASSEVVQRQNEAANEREAISNRAIAGEGSLGGTASRPNINSALPMSEWPVIIPKNVLEKTKVSDAETEPSLAEVQAEVEKVVFIKTETQELQKVTRNQQNILLVQVVAYGEAVADRALELSIKADEENQKMQKKVEETTDHLGLFIRMAELELGSMKKQAELLHLHSRLLEINSAAALINKDEPKDLSETSLASNSQPTAQ